MYTKGKITYSDAGYILRDGTNLGYSLENTSLNKVLDILPIWIRI